MFIYTLLIRWCLSCFAKLSLTGFISSGHDVVNVNLDVTEFRIQIWLHLPARSLLPQVRLFVGLNDNLFDTAFIIIWLETHWYTWHMHDMKEEGRIMFNATGESSEAKWPKKQRRNVMSFIEHSEKSGVHVCLFGVCVCVTNQSWPLKNTNTLSPSLAVIFEIKR